MRMLTGTAGQARTRCCGHIVAHDVSWAAQTGKHLLRTQNVSEQNQKHLLCLGHKICVRNKCWENICVGNNVSAKMCPRLPGPYVAAVLICSFSLNFSRLLLSLEEAAAEIRNSG